MANSDFALAISQLLNTPYQNLATTVRLDPNEVLFFQHDLGDALYIVREGRVEISVISESGKKLTLNEMRPGDVFGEIAALDGGPRTATATALAPSVLRRISRTDFLEILRKEGTLGTALIEVLCERLRWVSQQVEDLGLLDIQGRLANKLILLHKNFADEQGILHLSQNELADFVGGTRESTNKILQEWRSKGVIELSRRSIRICDPGALADIAIPV